MAELTELLEYLYGDSKDVRTHGIEGITALLKDDTRDLNQTNYHHLMRILVRTFQECRHNPADEAIAKVLVALILLIRRAPGAPDDHIGELGAYVQEYFEDLAATSHQSSCGDTESCRVLHVCLILLLSSPWMMKHRPSFVSLTCVIRCCNFHPLSLLSLELVGFCSTIADLHEEFDTYNLVGVLEPLLKTEDPTIREVALRALYNMSFHLPFLRQFTWELYWKSFESVCALRIIVHGLQSGVYSIPAGEKTSTVLCSLLRRAIEEEGKRKELLPLIRLVISRSSSSEKEEFTRCNKLLLLELLVVAIQERDDVLARPLLLLPNAWIRDKTQLIFDRVQGVAAENHDLLYIVARLCYSDKIAAQFPCILTWADDRYAERAAKSGRRDMTEKCQFAKYITNN